MNEHAYDDEEIPPIYATPPTALRESAEQRAKRLRAGVEGVLAEHAQSEAPPTRTSGRKRGTPNKAKPDPFDVEAQRKPPALPACRLCGDDTTLLSPEMTRELLRSSRDRLADVEPELRGKLAEGDLLYVTARLDGFCSLGCWRKAQE